MGQVYRRKDGELLANSADGDMQSVWRLAHSSHGGPGRDSRQRPASSDVAPQDQAPLFALEPSPPETATSIVHAFATDVILNADRTLMYIARDDGFISVYDTFTGLVVENFDVGTKLGGMDLSADGSFLLVVEKTAISSGGGQNVFAVHKVDVATGAVTDFTKIFFSIDGPFHDVALFADGTAIVSTTLQGSGATTTYRLDTQTGVFTTLASSSAQGPIVTASADRLNILLTNGYNVSGPNQMYALTAEAVILRTASRGVGSSGNSLHAFTADGSLVAYVEHQTGVDIFDSQLTKLTTIAGIQGNDVHGIAFDDHGDFLYVLVFSTSEILKVSTSDWSVAGQIDLPSDMALWQMSGSTRFGGTLVVGRDAQYLTWTNLEDVFRIENTTALTPVEGTGADETMTGTATQDLLYGLDGDDILNGGEGNDTLRGGSGNDVLDGGAGHDAMYGGDGDDIYHADDVRDRAAEADASGGSDEVHASVSFELEGNIERLILTGAAAIDGIGNAIANAITGNDAANTLDGMGGNDLLVAGGGDDILKGGTGADDMRGGADNDTYHVDQAGDVVVEGTGGGTDRVIASASYALGGNAEVETLEATTGSAAINLTGNSFAQTLIGNNGGNVLHGGGGADILRGLLGNDIYYIDVAATQIEEAAGGGVDRLFTSVTYVLAAGISVEVLSTNNHASTDAINLTGNGFNQTLIGNAGANVLHGGGGTDMLLGLGGNDIYYVDVAAAQIVEYEGGGNDTIYASVSYVLVNGEVETLSTNSYGATTAINLTGNLYSQTLIGNAGANVLNGGGGLDLLIGLGGNDIYYVDVAATQIVEYEGGGSDIVYASLNYTLGGNAEVETLSANDYASVLSLNLTGNLYAQTIIGNNGNNVLNGGGGADTLMGFHGDDTYYVDIASVQVVETVGGGNDTLYASVSYALASGVDIDILSTNNYASTDAIDLTGNAVSQTLLGNDGANWLDGSSGNDVLRGFGGADTFAFTVARDSDMIVDFVSGTDKIALNDTLFAGIGGPGALDANVFVIGNAAADADDRIIYNQASGQLFYDADGNGAGAAILFCNLAGTPVIAVSDFVVI